MSALIHSALLRINYVEDFINEKGFGSAQPDNLLFNSSNSQFNNILLLIIFLCFINYMMKFCIFIKAKFNA